jgi:hypothetical protein
MELYSGLINIAVTNAQILNSEDCVGICSLDVGSRVSHTRCANFKHFLCYVYVSTTTVRVLRVPKDKGFPCAISLLYTCGVQQ